MTTTNELLPLPCPFCGGAATCHPVKVRDWHVVCGGCPAEMTYYQGTETEVIAAWNRRVEPDERLREALQNLVNSAPSESDLRHFLECSGLDYKGPKLKVSAYGFALENARAILAEPQAKGENNATDE